MKPSFEGTSFPDSRMIIDLVDLITSWNCEYTHNFKFNVDSLVIQVFRIEWKCQSATPVLWIVAYTHKS